MYREREREREINMSLLLFCASASPANGASQVAGGCNRRDAGAGLDGEPSPPSAYSSNNYDDNNKSINTNNN